MVFNLHIQMTCRTLWTRCVAAFLVIVRARQYFRWREKAPTVLGDVDAALAAPSRLKCVLAHVISRSIFDLRNDSKVRHVVVCLKVLSLCLTHQFSLARYQHVH